VKEFRGIALHLLFWTVYFGVNLFNELYLSSSFTAHPSTELLLDSILAQLLVLAIKVPAVYYVLYSLIPRWSRAPSRLWLATEFLLVFFLLLLCYRGLVQLIIWPYIVRETPPPLSALQYTARFFYSLLDILQVTGIAAAIRLFRLRIAAVTKEKVLIKEKLQSEMQHLRAQINPHFLFNSLNSIYALTRSQSMAASDATMRLSNILRYTLYATEKKLVSLEEEIKTTLDYVELQQIRFADKVRFSLTRDIDDVGACITPQIILPLVENAFKHGTSGIVGPVEITLRIALKDDQLFIELHNPLGSVPLSTDSGAGIGLANMQRRLELLYHDYQFSHGQRENSFVVELHINLKSYADIELPDRRR